MKNTRGIQRGFTLIELMIVVAIIGVLAAVAYPSYQAQVLKSGRADAKVELNIISQRMQRCFTGVSTYKPAASICDVVDAVSAADGILSKEKQYIVKVSNHEATSYTLVATPVVGSRQAKDTSCAKFTLTQAGQRVAYNSSNADTTDECW